MYRFASGREGVNKQLYFFWGHLKKKYLLFFSFFIIFFRTCTQTGLEIQKIYLQVPSFQHTPDILNFFLIIYEHSKSYFNVITGQYISIPCHSQTRTKHADLVTLET